MSDDLVYKILMKKYPSMKGEEAVEHVRNYKKIIGGMNPSTPPRNIEHRRSIEDLKEQIKNARTLEELGRIKKYTNLNYHTDRKATPGDKIKYLNGIINNKKEELLKYHDIQEHNNIPRHPRNNVFVNPDKPDIYQGKPYDEHKAYENDKKHHEHMQDDYLQRQKEYDDRIAELKRKLKEDRAREEKEREGAEYDSDIEAHARKYVFPKRLDNSDDENRIFEFDEDLQKKEKQQGNGIKELKEQLKKEILEELADKKVEVVKVDNKPKKLTKWMEHVKKYRSKHPGISYKNALTEAKKTYVK